IPALAPTPVWSDAEVERLLAISTPVASPLSPWYEVVESLSTTAARLARGLRADYGFLATMDREMKCDLERDVGYGITNTWDEMLMDMPGAPVATDTELGRQMTELTTRVRDRRAHACTARLMETEARMSREAWGRSMNASDLAHVEVMSLCTTVLGQQTETDKDDRIQMTEFHRQQGLAKGPAQPEILEEAGSSS
ncbi:hypothetical protein Tco_0985619, partial [Tanacetum coccineum]